MTEETYYQGTVLVEADLLGAEKPYSVRVGNSNVGAYVTDLYHKAPLTSEIVAALERGDFVEARRAKEEGI